MTLYQVMMAMVHCWGSLERAASFAGQVMT